ncbi:DUF1707 domain-containing protein [Actinomadura sp. NPDC048955]|uniref:DUF1707 SHOCT-like domain-containing protein n=1 Tax=Actinomadura sp. NPDC048955 TaxID=3158228 RepID=UPI0033C2B1DC
MTNLPEHPGTPGAPEMRAGDADRERVAQVLRDAAGEGRLTLDELDERLDAVYAAKTYAELGPITRDLPSPGRAAPPATGADWRPVHGAPSWRSGIGIMSGSAARACGTSPAGSGRSRSGAAERSICGRPGSRRARS